MDECVIFIFLNYKVRTLPHFPWAIIWTISLSHPNDPFKQRSLYFPVFYLYLVFTYDYVLLHYFAFLQILKVYFFLMFTFSKFKIWIWQFNLLMNLHVLTVYARQTQFTALSHEVTVMLANILSSFYLTKILSASQSLFPWR